MSDVQAFYFNDRARIKPSEGTKARWRARAQELRKAYPSSAHLWPDEMKLDADGFYRGLLWDVIRLIAPECEAGGCPTEDGKIYLEIQRDMA